MFFFNLLAFQTMCQVSSYIFFRALLIIFFSECNDHFLISWVSSIMTLVMFIQNHIFNAVMIGRVQPFLIIQHSSSIQSIIWLFFLTGWVLSLLFYFLISNILSCCSFNHFSQGVLPLTARNLV